MHGRPSEAPARGDTRPGTCRTCGALVDAAQLYVLDVWVTVKRLCAPCARAARQAEEEEEQQKRDAEARRRAVLVAEGANMGLGLPLRYRSKTISGMERTEDNAAAVDVAGEWAEYPEGVLTFWGPAGVGKTHLAAGIVNHMFLSGMIGSGRRVFWPVAALTSRLRAAAFQAEVIRERIAQQRLLVLDDLAAASESEWMRGHIMAIVSLREQEGRPTILTTNLNLAEISALWDDRLASRLAGGLVVEIKGADHRLRHRRVEALQA